MKIAVPIVGFIVGFCVTLAVSGEPQSDSTSGFVVPVLVLSNRVKDPRWFADYVDSHIRKNHGPLGAMYWGGYMHEGDTWAILYLLSHANGLTDPDQPSQGGWGARFHRAPEWGSERIYVDDGRWKKDDDVSTIRFYREDIENDFAARMDWQVTEPDQANHNPVAALNGDASREVVYHGEAIPGATVLLDAKGSSDPDGDSLSYEWLYDARSSTYSVYENDSWSRLVTINNATSQQASFTVPNDLGDKSIQVVLRVRDNGNPPLVSYKRLVIGTVP